MLRPASLLLLTGCAITAPTTDPADSGAALPSVLPAAQAAALPAPRPPPDLVLITVEGLRADHTTPDGYSRDTTPWLARLASEGARFEAARAPSSWAAPTVATIFTGLYTNQHGIDRGVSQDGAVLGQPLLPEEHFTLAERLKAAGYATAGVTSSLHVGRTLGFAQGFDAFVELPFSHDAAALGAVAATLLPLDGAGPRFYWLHYNDPAEGFEAKAPWAQDWPVPEDADPLTGDLIRRYDSEIRSMDEQISATLAALDLSEDAVIAFTGTHGLALREHGLFGERQGLEDPSVRVPLVLRWPGHAAAGIHPQGPVSSADLLPTLVQAATGVAPAPPAVSGLSLAAAVAGAPLPERAIPLELRPNEERMIRALIAGQRKLLRVDGPEGTTSARLFDLSVDPDERRDRASDEPMEAARLNAALDQWLSASRTVAPGPRTRAEPAPDQ